MILRVWMRSHIRIVLLIVAASITGVQGVASDSRATFAIPSYPDVICVPVTIDGAAHLFMLDSGTTGYLFHTSLQQTLGPSKGKSKVSSANGELISAKVFNAPIAHIGGIALSENAHTACLDLTAFREASGRDIEGCLGMPVFTSNIIQIDFDAHRLFICDTTSEPTENLGRTIDVSNGTGGVPTIRADFGDSIDEPCIVDTGYTGSFSLASKLFDKLLRKQLIVADGENAAAVIGGVRTSRQGRLRGVNIGDMKLSNVAVVDGGKDSRVGLGYLRRFCVTFDIPHGRIHLSRGAAFDKPDKRPVGVGLLRKRDRTIVSIVQPNSPAEKAGITVSDELISIVNERVAGKPLAEVRWLLREKADSNGYVNLLLRRGDEERDIKVKLDD